MIILVLAKRSSQDVDECDLNPKKKKNLGLHVIVLITRISNNEVRD